MMLGMPRVRPQHCDKQLEHAATQLKFGREASHAARACGRHVCSSAVFDVMG
jgi:hypothetical protein